MSKGKNRLNGDASFGVIEGFVDVREAVSLDEPVKGKSALTPKLDELVG